MAGLTERGFEPKTQTEIQQNITERLKTFFGQDIDVSVGSRFGTLIDIFSFELADAWLGLQADYNSRFPAFATFNNLDNVGSIKTVARKGEIPAEASVFLGSSSPDVTFPSGLVMGIAGTDTREFTLDNATPIDSDCTLIILEDIPTSGDLVLTWSGDPDVTIPSGSDSFEILQLLEAALPNALPITVSGSLKSERALHITVTSGANPSPVIKIHDSSSLLRGSYVVNGEAYLSNATPASVTGLITTGAAITPYMISETVSTFPDFKAVTNFLAGTPGIPRELDSAYRDRIEEESQAIGRATVGGYKASLEAVAGVTNVKIVENEQAYTVDDRPANTFEVYIDGGSDNEVAQAIYDYKPLGIRNVSTLPVNSLSRRTGTYTNVNGKELSMAFSSSVDVSIDFQVIYTYDKAAFPSDGESQITSALIAYIDTLGLGETLFNYKLFTPLNTIPGIVTIDINTKKAEEEAFSNENLIVSDFEKLTTVKERFTFFPEES